MNEQVSPRLVGYGHLNWYNSLLEGYWAICIKCLKNVDSPDTIIPPLGIYPEKIIRGAGFATPKIRIHRDSVNYLMVLSYKGPLGRNRPSFCSALRAHLTIPIVDVPLWPSRCVLHHPGPCTQPRSECVQWAAHRTRQVARLSPPPLVPPAQSHQLPCPRPFRWAAAPLLAPSAVLRGLKGNWFPGGP